MKTDKERLEQLQDLLVDEWIRQAKGVEPKMSASSMQAAAKFLKDNGVYVPIETGDPSDILDAEEDDMGDVLPFKVVNGDDEG